MNVTRNLNKENVLWAILIITQIFFLGYAWQHQQIKTADSDEYIHQAYNIVHYGVIYSGDYTLPEKDPALYGLRTPGYPLFLIFSKILFNSNFFPLLLQCILSILNIYLGYKIVKTISANRVKSHHYLLFFLFFPSQFIYSTIFMSEILFQSTLLLCIFYLLKFESSGKYKHLYIHHFLLALTYIIKPIALFLWLGYILYGIFVHNNRGIAPRQIILGFMHVLLLGSFGLKNYYHTGIAEYSGIGRKLLINYNMPALISFYENPEYAKVKIDSFQSRIKNEPYAEQCANIDLFIRKEVLGHPIDFITLQFVGATKFFLESGRWDLELWKNGYQHLENIPSLRKAYSLEGISGIYNEIKQLPLLQLIYIPFVVLSNFVLFALFLYSIFSKSILLRYKIILWCTVLYFALLTGPSASARFRLPVFPIMVILAVNGMSNMGQKTKNIMADPFN